MPDDMDTEPLNEWIVSEWSRTQDALKDLMRRHEEILNHLADVCRRNDKMEQAGDFLCSVLLNIDTPVRLNHETGQHRHLKDEVDEALRQWGEANT